jgi:hypothetical protein
MVVAGMKLEEIVLIGMMEKIARNVATILTIIGTDMKMDNGNGLTKMAAAAAASTEINGDQKRIGEMATMMMNSMIPIRINGTSTDAAHGSRRVENTWGGTTEKIMNLVATMTMAIGIFIVVVDGNGIAVITNRYRRQSLTKEYLIVQ